jgi:hypothetical protein
MAQMGTVDDMFVGSAVHWARVMVSVLMLKEAGHQ